MGGIMRRLFVLLGLLLVTVACCNGKRLWGVDVGKKEENGEFESLLAQAAGARGAVADGDLGSVLAMLKDNMSKLSLSEICTYLGDLVDLSIMVIQDPAWQQELSEPGAIRAILDNSGLEVLMEKDVVGGPVKDDLLELLSLEGNPVLYRTKFIELVDKSVAKLTKFRKDVSDPAKLTKMVKDALQAVGMDEENINEVVELMENPALLAEQMEAFLDDPVVVAEMNRAMQDFTRKFALLENEGIEDDEVIRMLNGLGENPEFADEVYAELLKDPEVAQVLKASGLGGVGGVGTRRGWAG